MEWILRVLQWLSNNARDAFFGSDAWNAFWDFFTNDRAPWWATLVATLLGGLVAWFASHSLEKTRRESDRQKAADARQLELEDARKASSIKLLSDFYSAMTKYRQQYRQLFANLTGAYHIEMLTNNLAVPGYRELHNQEAAKIGEILAELESIYARIIIELGDDMRKIADPALSAIGEAPLHGSPEEFHSHEANIISAAALFINESKNLIHKKEQEQGVTPDNRARPEDSE